MSAQHATVIGGGVAGSYAAAYLRREGFDVSLYEARELGAGASSGNAGWIAPAQAGPLPAPGLVAFGARSLLEPGSPLYFRPGYLPRLTPWLGRFALRCNERSYARGAEALAELGEEVFPLLTELESDGLELEATPGELLVVSSELDEATEFAERLPKRIGSWRELGTSEIRELEPQLSDEVAAGVLVEEHWRVEPLRLMDALRRYLTRLGVRIAEQSPVSRIGFDGPVARELALGSETVSISGPVVIATGAWARELKAGGSRLPIEAGRGYSFWVPAEQPPRRPILLLDPHIGISPGEDGFRVAGTMEFSGLDADPDHRRLDPMVTGARRFLPHADYEAMGRPWSGMRPIAPDGLPVIGNLAPGSNVWFATGYSMLGMTLAAPAASRLARSVRAGKELSDISAFSPQRFLKPRRLGRPA